jgi:hypothetical protein
VGSDLLIMTMSWKPKSKREGLADGFLRCCKNIDNRIRALKKYPSCDPDNINPDWNNRGGPVWRDDTDEPVTLDEVKKVLHDRVKDLRDSWGARDTTITTEKGVRVFITGGMSAGDSPGETFDVLCVLSYAGVL